MVAACNQVLLSQRDRETKNYKNEYKCVPHNSHMHHANINYGVCYVVFWDECTARILVWTNLIYSNLGITIHYPKYANNYAFLHTSFILYPKTLRIYNKLIKNSQNFVQ